MKRFQKKKKINSFYDENKKRIFAKGTTYDFQLLKDDAKLYENESDVLLTNWDIEKDIDTFIDTIL